MRKLGYVSLRDIAEGYDPSQGGMQSPAFQHSAHIPGKRSEIRPGGAESKNSVPSVVSKYASEQERHSLSRDSHPNRSELRKFIRMVRDGTFVAAIIVFYGILPATAHAFMIERFAFYAPQMMKPAYQSDLVVPEVSKSLLSVLSNPNVNPSNTLFLEAQSLPAADLLSNLKTLSLAPFKVVILFTNQKNFDLAREELGGKTELRNLQIEIGANVLGMLTEKVGAAVRDNPEMKNQIAFAGRGAEARRARTMSSNLIAFEGSNIPWSLVFEAITSPAVFNFYRNGTPNKIWSIRNVVSVLMSAAQAIARAA